MDEKTVISSKAGSASAVDPIYPQNEEDFMTDKMKRRRRKIHAICDKRYRQDQRGGISKSWTHMLVVKLLLRLFKAGFFLGCMYLISCWYRRYQVHQRFAWFYSINIPANAFSSLLAYA
ncbi:hypothetical protein PAAG_08124 [Paracoccidioides lutzii Pb01]|uniref:Uncharacterized protein n=1 Tax=Paracoccidioides lutzii (strain ATCC MYA-826 / Pb01) TaxID=502779 RepID=C1HBI3_PARBA|nr:hypothetical protein PAAG_08124 [Paracoccidioides lutzii Pb01]EEH37706.2 hypothetical protein PAAG_08124 [Paracoccidioides lutzii Pb01]